MGQNIGEEKEERIAHALHHMMTSGVDFPSLRSDFSGRVTCVPITISSHVIPTERKDTPSSEQNKGICVCASHSSLPSFLILIPKAMSRFFFFFSPVPESSVSIYLFLLSTAPEGCVLISLFFLNFTSTISLFFLSPVPEGNV